ncbi:hypothetical protein F5884DRAFT_269211 [Xylogone sp. PMI_703]|nr:hypothetical protein F5884DRAFT_269211 [Xylogone sp. PMI_703]
MAPNKAFIYKNVPQSLPIPGRDLTVETLEFDETAVPPPGGFTTKNFYAAFDPSQRGRMRDPSLKSYSPPMVVGQPVISVSVIGKVLKSDNLKLKENDIVLLTSARTEEYGTHDASIVEKTQVITQTYGVPLTSYLGVLGMTGMTAYGSLHEIGQPKKGETILISAAAGAVGQTVGQIALREGLRVIGSVGDDRKVEFITNELGFSGAFNYKKDDWKEKLEELTPNGIDIYFDNVGAKMLEAALDRMNDFGRIVACGGISQYHMAPGESFGVRNTIQVARKRIRWQGFIVYDPNITQWKDRRDHNISKWLADGSFKSIDHITEGIDNAISGFLGMLKGENLGKSILKIADPDKD